jgi:pimeloyl-ACP methyl ester carboxylesterase
MARRRLQVLALLADVRASAERNAVQGETAMPFYAKGDVRIHYEEAGAGFPLLLIPGGGLNSNIGFWSSGAPFNAMEAFKDEYRCITMDLRNANSGQSSGPVQVEKPWDAYADDQLGLMDHLGIQEFMVLGCCIGGPFVLKLMERAPDRIVAGVLCQPSGHRPENPDVMYNNNIRTWGPTLCARRPDVTMEIVDAYLHALYRSPGDFVYSVTRDFVRSCQTPMLVMPDDVPAHPYAVAMEVVRLAPKAEVTMYPWKEPKDLIPQAVHHVRDFLRAHQPVPAAR